MDARDFGFTDTPAQAAAEEVRRYVALSPAERYRRFLDLMAFLEEAWRSVEPSRRARYERANDAVDDPGRWWERVPRS